MSTAIHISHYVTQGGNGKIWWSLRGVTGWEPGGASRTQAVEAMEAVQLHSISPQLSLCQCDLAHLSKAYILIFDCPLLGSQFRLCTFRGHWGFTILYYTIHRGWLSNWDVDYRASMLRNQCLMCSESRMTRGSEELLHNDLCSNLWVDHQSSGQDFLFIFISNLQHMRLLGLLRLTICKWSRESAVLWQILLLINITVPREDE